MMLRNMVAAFALAVVPIAAFADETVKCMANPTLPPVLAGWSKASSAKTMSTFRPEALAQWPALTAQRTGLALHPAASLAWWVAPGKASMPESFGGMLPVKIETAGTVRIALSDAAWIDLIRAGAAVPSTTHGHGPDCSGIRKIVSFEVTPGLYLLQISGAAKDSLSAMAIAP